MTAFDRVRAFIQRLTPQPVCDPCISERLASIQIANVGRHTIELAGTAGFERRIDACSLCGEARHVTRYSS